jgi:hypothetical protein
MAIGCEHERAGKTEMSFVFSKQMRSALTYLSKCIQNLDVSTKIEYTLQEYKSIFLTVITNHKCDSDFSRGMSHARNVSVFVHSQTIIVWKHSDPWSWRKNSSRHQLRVHLYTFGLTYQSSYSVSNEARLSTIRCLHSPPQI